MLTLDEVHHKQNSFAKACRTGNISEKLNINEKRIPIYHNMIFSNIEKYLKYAYPITYDLLSKKQWDQLTYEFVTEHDCTTAAFRKMPKELCIFVKKRNYAKEFQIPYLDDLLLFEWLEIEVHQMPDQTFEKHRVIGDVLKDQLLLNPEFILYRFSYPVFKKHPLPKETNAGSYPLFIYRHPDTLNVHFISLSPFFATVIQELTQKSSSGKAVLKKVLKAHPIADENKVFSTGKAFFESLLKERAIYGFQL